MVEYYPYEIELEETEDEIVTSGRIFHEQMQNAYEEHRLELAMKSQEHWKEMKPPVLRYNPRGYPKLQYFCKV